MLNMSKYKEYSSLNLPEFEENVLSSLNIDINPFKLIFEGELDKQE